MFTSEPKELTDVARVFLEPANATHRQYEALHGLVPLARLSGLRHLTLNGTRITDAGLTHLAGLRGLEELWVDNTAISDAGLPHLKGLTRLKLLQLYNSRVTGAGEAEILKALPGVSFYP